MNNQLARKALCISISMAMLLPGLTQAQTDAGYTAPSAANGLSSVTQLEVRTDRVVETVDPREERRARMQAEREKHKAEHALKIAQEALEEKKAQQEAAAKKKKNKKSAKDENIAHTDIADVSYSSSHLSPEQLQAQLAEKLKLQEKAEEEAKSKAEQLRQDSERLKQQVESLNQQALAKAQAEAAQKERIRLEKERRARELAEQKAREEQERQAKIEATKKAAADALAKAKAEEELKLKLETQLKANQAAEKKAAEEAEKLRLEKKRIAQALQLAKNEAELKARIERERKAEEERKARIEAERIAEEKRLKAEQERKAEEARLAKIEAERLAEAARMKQEQERKEEEARQAKFEADLRAREEAARQKEERLRLAEEARQDRIKKAIQAKAEKEQRIKEAAQAKLDAAERVKQERIKTAQLAREEAARQKEAEIQLRARADNQSTTYNALQKPLGLQSVPVPTVDQSNYQMKGTQSALQVATSKIAGVYQSPLRAQYLGFTASESQMQELHGRTKYDAKRLSILPRAIGEIQLLPVVRLSGDSIVMFKNPEDKKVVEEFMSYYPLHAQVFGNYIKRVITLQGGKTGGATIDRAIMEELTYDISIAPVPSSSLNNAQDTYLYFSSRLSDNDQVKFWNWVNAVKQNGEIRVPSWIRLADVIYSH